MSTTFKAALACGALLAAAHTGASAAQTPKFLTSLDRNGELSAGWVQVLPVLATACNLRLDNRELTDRLVDLSRQTGNISYTKDLYTKLYMMQMHRAKNNFVQSWTAMFGGNQDEACHVAASLWGDGGNQFPGVLKRDAIGDSADTPAPDTAPGTQ